MSEAKMKMNKVLEGAFVEDEKRPAKLIVKADRTGDPGMYMITILHPNRKSIEDEFTKLYQAVHKAKDVFEAMDIGNKIKETQFFDVVTTHEDIKFIPNYKKGKMKLNTKEDAVAAAAVAAAATAAAMETNKIIPPIADKKPKQIKKPQNKKVPAKKAKKHT